MLGDDEIVLRDEKQCNTNESRSSTAQLVPSVPPIRLRRQLIDNTDKNDRADHDKNAANDKHGDESDDDQRYVTYSVRPLKRSLHGPPSPVACKKARWEVIALVRTFTSL